MKKAPKKSGLFCVSHCFDNAVLSMSAALRSGFRALGGKAGTSTSDSDGVLDGEIDGFSFEFCCKTSTIYM